VTDELYCAARVSEPERTRVNRDDAASHAQRCLQVHTFYSGKRLRVRGSSVGAVIAG